jgi:hypothetical protein
MGAGPVQEAKWLRPGKRAQRWRGQGGRAPSFAAAGAHCGPRRCNAMTGCGVPDSDMPNFQWPGRRDASAIGDAALEAVLGGTQVPEDPAAGLQLLADVVAALRAGPATAELAGEAVAMAEFRERVGVSSPVRQSVPRRPTLLSSLLSAKVAGAAAVAVIGIGGIATAAYAGALPTPVQQLAHDAIGAPAARQGTPLASTMANAAARHRHRHWRRHGCQPAPRPSGTVSPSPTPSGTPSPTPSWTPRPRPTCVPFPRPSRTPRPRPTCPSATPSPTPTPSGTPSPTPSWTPRPRPICAPFPRHHHHHHHHHPYPHPTPSPSGSPSSGT